MTTRSLILLAMISALPAAVNGDHHYEYRYGHYRQEPLLVVDTKSCAGDQGLASFRAERVFKIEAGDCRDPDDQNKKLYQVMLRTLTGAGDYEVIWVDYAGMRTIREQLAENRRHALHARDCYRSPDQFDNED